MVIECLCSYICLCCCEQEVVTPSILTELSVKCTKISHCIGKITDTFDQQMCSYFRCSEIKKLCGDCKALKSKKSAKRTKKTKKKRRGGASYKSVTLEGLEDLEDLEDKNLKPVNNEKFRFSGVDWGLDMNQLTDVGWDESKGHYLEHKKKRN